MPYVQTSVTQWLFRLSFIPMIFCSCSPLTLSRETDYPATPEAVLRAVFRANEARSMADLERLVANDMVGYSVGGRKYVGWDDLKREMQQEFETATRIDIPIKDLHVWERGDVARYTAEIDYIRSEGSGDHARKMVLSLHESGVLERRQGHWMLVQWHESFERPPETQQVGTQGETPAARAASFDGPRDLSGTWEIQEEDKTYRAVLDAAGNGTYTWQHGTLLTTRVADGRWEGVWRQTGNDREGGFEVRLSEDGTMAQGTWWYSRVGNRNNIPPRQWGGTYRLKRE